MRGFRIGSGRNGRPGFASTSAVQKSAVLKIGFGSRIAAKATVVQAQFGGWLSRRNRNGKRSDRGVNL